MISDVLSDAVHEITQYQKDFKFYDEIKTEIEKVKMEMKLLQSRLDGTYYDPNKPSFLGGAE